MADSPELRYYTAGQLKDWLIKGQAAEGLSEQVIARQRAWAIVNNPFVTDGMEIVSALFVDGKLAAYTACFPDRIERPEPKLIFWCTTLFCFPEFRGRGYGMFVLGHLMEAHEGLLFDVDAVDETNESLQFLGHKIEQFPQRIIYFEKSIRGNGIKAVAARLRERYALKRRQRKAQEALSDCLSKNYSLEYIRDIDEPTYRFIEAHSGEDFFLRSRGTLNWILSQPFLLTAPVGEKLVAQNNFSSSTAEFGFIAVKVFVSDQLVGFYILRTSQKELALKYLYFDAAFKEEVFSSITAHVIRLGRKTFASNDAEIAFFIENLSFHTRAETIHRSFAHPSDFSVPYRFYLHAGDGDMIT